MNIFEFMWVTSHIGNTGYEKVDLYIYQVISIFEHIVIKSLPYKDILKIVI